MEFKENSKPIYLQIADRICDAIMSGAYASADRIPSVREAAATFKVNANTMMRVYEHLAAREIIRNQRGIGFFITEVAREKIEQMRQETFFNDEMAYFFDRFNNMGVNAEQLKTMYTKYLDK